MVQQISSFPYQLHVERLTVAELLACAMCQLFPQTQLFSGGVNELGFYYDFHLDTALDLNFIPMIEEAMHRLIKESHSIGNREMMRENAAGFFSHHQQPLKAALVLDIPQNVVQLIEFAGFFDIAPTHYLSSINEMGVFKLLEIQRIEHFDQNLGTLSLFRVRGEVFSDKQHLKKFNKNLKAELEYSSLTETMELYKQDPAVSDLAGSWLPKGMALRDSIVSLWRKALRHSEVAEITTPSFVKEKFSKSRTENPIGFDWGENTYELLESPAELHAALFKSKERQGIELPIRYAEVKEIFKESSLSPLSIGMLHSSSQLIDFTFSFCTNEQLEGEIISSLLFIQKMVNILGLRCHWTVLSRKGKTAGTPKQWDQTLSLMRKALETCGCIYSEDPYDQVWSGPKLKGYFQDQMGRWWDGPQLAVDFHLQAQLELSCVKLGGERAKVSMLKQTTFGPLERLIALLIERNRGELPLWLAPEQVRVICVGDIQQQYARNVLRRLIEADVRATGDFRDPVLGCSLGTRIYACESAKVPYALLIGDKEESNNIVNVRRCGSKSSSEKMSLETFLQRLQQNTQFLAPHWRPEIINRSHELV